MSSPTLLHDHLRQMFALLETERQALAAVDLERIVTCADGKMRLCDAIDRADDVVDEECRALLDAVMRLNDVNRRFRNLIASNIHSRLAALSGGTSIYEARRARPAKDAGASA